MSTEAISINTDIRDKSGSKYARRLRKEGMLPAVVYGHGQESIAIALNAHDFIKGLHHGHRLFTVDLKGQAETLLLKDVQYDYLGKDIIHVDLIRVDLTERVTVEVPIEFRGVAKGTTMGGMLDEVMTHLEIESEVTRIPDVIAVVVRDLDVGDALHAKDIELPEGCVLMTDPEALVVLCHESKVAAAEEEGAEEELEGASAEPEVITERKEEDEAEQS